MTDSPLSDSVLVLAGHASLRAHAPAGAQALASEWGPLRQRQFLAGRGAAALALARLGAEVVEVGRAEEGAPRWSPAVVGSLAHDVERAVALVGWQRDWLALGVDVEPDQPLDADAAGIVLLPEERVALDTSGGLRHGRLLFGAKECVHKAIHPLRGAWLEFDEVRIVWSGALDAEAGTWQPQAISAAAIAAFEGLAFTGRWQRRDGALLSLLGVRPRP